jgi:hypothetical protein
MAIAWRAGRGAWLALGVLAIAVHARAEGPPCALQLDSTFALIEKVIFADRGCTSSGCHDESAQGGLVLLPGAAYDHLIDQPVESVPAEQFPGLRRVVPARKDRSLLWLNVAAATMPDLWKAPKQPMPIGFPPLAQNELDLLSMWFDYGAPRAGVGIALGRKGLAACPRFDADEDGRISIDELVTAVDAAMHPEALKDGAESLIYTSLTYADPLVLGLDPPLEIRDWTSIYERTLTYCAEYDNGFTDPSTVKRLSTVPSNGAGCSPTHCAEGRVGERCQGASQAQRHQFCDSRPGKGDGLCDACAVGFGVSTDDEMIVLTGAYVEG